MWSSYTHIHTRTCCYTFACASIETMLKFQLDYSILFYFLFRGTFICVWWETRGRDCYTYLNEMCHEQKKKSHMKCNSTMNTHQSGIVSSLQHPICFDFLVIIFFVWHVCIIIGWICVLRCVCVNVCFADVSIELVCSCDSLINWLMEPNYKSFNRLASASNFEPPHKKASTQQCWTIKSQI